VSRQSIIVLAFIVSELVSLKTVRAQEFTADSIAHLGGGRENKAKLYVGHGKLRLEPQQGPALVIILDSSSPAMYVLTPADKRYVEQPSNMARQNLAMFGLGGAGVGPCLEGDASGTCKKLGNEVIDGRATEKWQVSDTFKGRTFTFLYWMDTSLHLAVKTQGGGIMGDLQNIREGPQPASLFEIPADYHRMDMPGSPPH